MDLRGLDSQWRGFSDHDIQKVKNKPPPSPRSSSDEGGRATSDTDPPPSGSSRRHPLEQVTVKPPQPSLHDDHTSNTSITTETISADGDGDSKGKTTPSQPDVPTQQPAMLIDQQEGPTPQQALAEAELSEKSVNYVIFRNYFLLIRLSPAQKALQLKRQQEIEEENKKKQKLVEKTLKERYSLTQQESERLKKVHTELASLDKLVTRDVAILREKIEAANMQHNRARSAKMTMDSLS